MDDVLENGYYESPPAYDNVDWFVDEVNKIEKRMAFFFKNTNRDKIKTEKDKERFRDNNNCRFCEK